MLTVILLRYVQMNRSDGWKEQITLLQDPSGADFAQFLIKSSNSNWDN
jgi:hypothetical protein